MSITINGTTGISGVDGSSTTPAFQGTDTNTGLFYGTDIVGISTGGSERVRVDASGNVGIGTTSPSEKLRVQNTTGVNTTFTNNVDADVKINLTSGVSLISPSTGTLALGTSNTERMRIDSSGTLLVGKAVTDNATQGLALYPDGQMRMTTNGTASTTIIGFFRNSSSTLVGQISTTSTATTYSTSSDYRLKENIIPMVGALDKVAQLKPVTYTWKADGSDGQGFIAHELQEVVPDAVTGEKDAVETYTDEEGNEQTRIKPQGVDTSFLVATLTAAIQEQQTIINDLKARVTALEAKIV